MLSLIASSANLEQLYADQKGGLMVPAWLPMLMMRPGTPVAAAQAWIQVALVMYRVLLLSSALQHASVDPAQQLRSGGARTPPATGITWTDDTARQYISKPEHQYVKVAARCT